MIYYALILTFLCYQQVMSVPLTINCTAGDVRFGDVSPGDWIGFLQVCQYVPEKSGNDWVLVCSSDEKKNNGAIHAACRQLGFVNATGNCTAKKGDPGGPNTSKYRHAIHYINCPIVKNYVTDGELVLMRCSHGNIINASDCPGFLHITCNENHLITDDPYVYNGQVQLQLKDYQKHHNERFPVSLYLANQGWRLVCVLPDMINTATAENETNFRFDDTICRQLGFTNAIGSPKFGRPPTDKKYFQIEGEFHCGCTCPSLACIMSCLNADNLKAVDQCSHGYQTIAIACVYVEQNASVFSSGSNSLCGHIAQLNDASQYTTDLLIVISVLAVLVVVMLVITVISVSVGIRCWWTARGRRAEYQQVN